MNNKNQNTVIDNFQWLYWPSRLVGLNAYHLPRDQFKHKTAYIAWPSIFVCIIQMFLMGLSCHFNVQLNMSFNYTRSLIINAGFSCVVGGCVLLMICMVIFDIKNHKRIWSILLKLDDFDKAVSEVYPYFLQYICTSILFLVDRW